MTNIIRWQCPYCGHFQVLSNESTKLGTTITNHGNAFVKISEYGDIGLWARSTACLNPECKKLTLTVGLSEVLRQMYTGPSLRTSVEKIKWHLLPDSIAKPQPQYIPEAIRQDYEEACKIARHSPKASATLARRCLQGMIRGFCGITGRSLYQEIEALESKFKQNQAPQGITAESIKAIDNVRKMGNIGAHMQIQDAVIVDIDEEEANLLIELIEMLFKEWYVAQHERSERLKKLNRTVEEKSNSKIMRKVTRKKQIHNATQKLPAKRP